MCRKLRPSVHSLDSPAAYSCVTPTTYIRDKMSSTAVIVNWQQEQKQSNFTRFRSGLAISTIFNIESSKILNFSFLTTTIFCTHNSLSGALHFILFNWHVGAVVKSHLLKVSAAARKWTESHFQIICEHILLLLCYRVQRGAQHTVHRPHRSAHTERTRPPAKEAR